MAWPVTVISTEVYFLATAVLVRKLDVNYQLIISVSTDSCILIFYSLLTRGMQVRLHGRMAVKSTRV